MKLFLDTEFNGFGGELISLAIVAEDNREWYGVLPLPNKIDKWVQEHVVPFLGHPDGPKLPNNYALKHEFQASLAKFLVQFPDAEIIADWPSDFEHLCYMMTYAGQRAGWRIPINCTMRLQRVEGINPEIPHNALSDARALKEAYLKNEQRNAYIATQVVELGDSGREYASAIYPLAI